jgi:hypothetical protein
MFLRPKGTHLTLPISAAQGDHSQQHTGMFFHPMGIDSPWPISAS